MKQGSVWQKLRSGLRRIRVPLLIILAAASVGLFWKYYSDTRHLQQFAAKYVTGEELPSEMTLKLVRGIRRDLPSPANTGYYLLPVFDFLRPTAFQVSQTGGNCADKSRLLIVLLRQYGVRSQKYALYDDAQVPRHAVVDVEIEDRRRMVVDPYFGLYFPREEGGYYSLQDLKADEGILRARIAFLTAERSDTLGPRIARYKFDRYPYRHARSINWDKAGWSRQIYRWLKSFMGEQVDELTYPYIVERPEVVVLLGAVFLELLIAATLIPALRRH